MSEWTFLSPEDERLNFSAPQEMTRRKSVRLERFPADSYKMVEGQIGPMANMRSSSQCYVIFKTDSPVVRIRLDRLRHHLQHPCGIVLGVTPAHKNMRFSESEDLRAREGDIELRMLTGLERGRGLAEVRIYMPSVSTCSFGGVSVAPESEIAAVEAPVPTWLAIGDSLTQGVGVQSPAQIWNRLAAREWGQEYWNLGVGGIQVEPDVWNWALEAYPWQRLCIGLGSNHAWRDETVIGVRERCEKIIDNALARVPADCKICWLQAPWKPIEDGMGPGEFLGTPLVPATAARLEQVREQIREAVAKYPRITLLQDLMPHDHRLLPDGLHPQAAASAVYAENLLAAWN